MIATLPSAGTVARTTRPATDSVRHRHTGSIAAILSYLVYRVALWLASAGPTATVNTDPAPSAS